MPTSSNVSQTIIIFISFLFALLFSQTMLRSGALLFIALLALTFIVKTIVTARKSRFTLISCDLVDLFTLTTISTLTVLLTGGIASPLFFIFYFLLFSLSFLYGIGACLVASVAIVVYFGVAAILGINQFSPSSYLALLSLALMTPFTSILAFQQNKIASQQSQLHDLSEEKKYVLKHSAIAEENLLLWLSTTMREHMQSVDEAIRELNFSVEQRLGNPNQWKRLKHQFNRLKILTYRLETDIEEGKLSQKT